MGGINVVTGGLGYIGQSIVARLRNQGEPVVIVDRRHIPSQVTGVPIVTGDIRDKEVWQTFTGETLRAVFHCAGLIQVGESVVDPRHYFQDNVAAGIQMLDHLTSLGTVPLIFSSSAAVYGMPDETPIVETAALRPVNPYGVTKRQFEEILAAYHHAYGLSYIALRYFNAAGSDGLVRENHEPESHLLPRVASLIRLGQAPVIYGHDYPTPDGTAIRDYVHIRDLVEAHLLARDYLEAGGQSMALNVGSGQGTSVAQMVSAFARVVAEMRPPTYANRRPGDPPVLVAAIGAAREVLGWRPQHSDIGEMIGEVWNGVE